MPPPEPPIFLPPFCEQYQNIANARLEGAEFESMYDTGGWFTGLSGSHVRGHNVQTGAPLAKIPPDFIATTVGARFLDLTIAVRWQAVAAKHLADITFDPISGVRLFPPTGSYNLINLYVGYQISSNAIASLSVEKLLNQEYSRYLTAFPNEFMQTIVVFLQPGITIKGSLRLRFAGG